MTALLSALAISIVSGWVGGNPVTPAELARALDHGPPVVGLVVAAAIAVGLRSGSRGGPLVLLPADVVLVLLAPIPRTAALRGPAFRQLRFSGFAGLVAGMVAGNLAAQRLPGPYAAWVAAGGVAGAVTGLAFTGSALLACGLRVGRRVAGLLAAAVLGASLADLLAGAASTPATFLGRLAMAPLSGLPAPAVGLVLLALPLAGLAAVGGTSLEAARRRAGLVAQLRFAVTMQDVRTVILLRRQLASEGARRRPWLRLPPGCGPPVLRRDLQGVLRWPAVRLVRLLGLGAGAGVAAAAAWRGTPALAALAGVALLVAGFEAVEGMAQEADHPLRASTLPVAAGWLRVRHLAVPALLMVGVAVVAVAAGGALAGEDAGAVVGVGVLAGVPAALAAVSGAAVSIETGPINPLQVGPLGNVAAAARAFGPGILAVVGVLPLLSARTTVDAGGSAVAGALAGALPVMIVVGGVTVWMRRGR